MSQQVHRPLEIVNDLVAVKRDVFVVFFTFILIFTLILALLKFVILGLVVGNEWRVIRLNVCLCIGTRNAIRLVARVGCDLLLLGW